MGSSPPRSFQFIDLLGELAALGGQRLDFLLHLSCQTLRLIHLKTKCLVLSLKGLEFCAKLSLPISDAAPLNAGQERQRGENDDGDNHPRPVPWLFLQVLQVLFSRHIQLGHLSGILPTRPEDCQSFSVLRRSDPLGYNLAQELMLFSTLAHHFQQYVGALNYMRKVRLRPELHPGPHQDALRLLAEW